MPVIHNDSSNLSDFELIPFTSLINQGVSSVMVGHLFFPKIDPTYPATLSKIIVNDLLRIKYKYDGLIVSDALMMNSISNKYSSGSAAVMAFDAGIDLIMMPKDIDEAINSLTDAFYSEKISIERLNISKERRRKQLDLIYNEKDSNKGERMDEDTKNRFLSDSLRFSKYIIKKSIIVREERSIVAGTNDINLIQIDNFEQASNKFFPALNLPSLLAFRNLIIHPFNINQISNNNANFLDSERIGNSKILIQLFVRGKPFIGADYNNEGWIYAIKKLEIEERLLGIIIYGCPYLYKKIRQNIREKVPLAYSPSQIDEAQKQTLKRIMKSNIFENGIGRKSINEFTD